ncbi:disease resistance protein RPM1-like [Cornus florida]|uniref:disease resistance protein RPM1-like n=1 Tax=Cornus florida TaxID=4283 RepID=UPI00289A2B4A|nr:disease resistance protein RPM1-like [Cornus florida]
MVKDFLQHQRYVIVLDDIWNIDVWEAVKRSMPNSNCGSRIIITTRFANIAAALSVNSSIYYLQPLSPEESWTLFCKKILKRCEGLPLAIVAIGGVLSSKDKSKTIEWELISRSLGAELESNESLKNVTKILSLSYYDLPYYLKCCFLYLSIFPEDDLIEPMRLIRLWIAEGFVEGKQGRTLEEVVESYLNELTNRGVVQIAETTTGGRVRKCRVHDLLGENILSKSRDLNFVNIIGENKTVLHEKVRRLSLHNACNNTLPKKSSPHLRSLFTFRGSLSNSSIRSFLGSAKLLKVLDLRGAPIDQFPNEVVNLFHLRYLSLRSTMVDKLPRSIDKLQNLETLDLKYTNVCKLPGQILKLKQLHHLLVYRYLEITSFVPFGAKQGFDAPLGIGSLTSLQKLSRIRADQGGSIPRELASLTQLRRLGIKGLRKEDGKFIC